MKIYNWKYRIDESFTDDVEDNKSMDVESKHNASKSGLKQVKTTPRFICLAFLRHFLISPDSKQELSGVLVQSVYEKYFTIYTSINSSAHKTPDLFMLWLYRGPGFVSALPLSSFTLASHTWKDLTLLLWRIVQTYLATEANKGK